MQTTVALILWLVISLIPISSENHVMKNERVVTEGRRHCRWRNHFLKVTANGSGLCSLCKRCPAGQSIERRCTRQKDTICKDCPSGYFSPEGAKRCHRCHHSCPAGTKMIKNCTTSSNIECSPCESGTYLHRKSICAPCKQMCPRGTYVKSQCTFKKDTVCSPCPTGTYFDEPNINNFCESCHYCGYGRETIHLCTRKSDSVCGGCKEGFFRNPVSLECEKCTRYFPDLQRIQREQCRMKGFDQTESYRITSTTTSGNLSPKENDVRMTQVLRTSDVKTVIVAISVPVITGFVVICIVVIVRNNKQKKSTSGDDNKKRNNELFEIEEDVSPKARSRIFCLSTQHYHQFAGNIRVSNSAPCMKCPLDSDVTANRYSYPTNDHYAADCHACPYDWGKDEESLESDTDMISVSLSCLHTNNTASDNTNKDTHTRVDTNSCSTNPGFTIENIDTQLTTSHENQTRQLGCHDYYPDKNFQSCFMEHHFLPIV